MTHVSLLCEEDPPPFEVVRPDATSNAFLLCDHASHAIPRSLGTLGLSERERLDHIGWDIGAAEMARELSRLLDATLVLSGYSRLVIDCNRPPHVSTSVPELTGGVRVPGNERITADQRQSRADACFWPYHREIERLLDVRTAASQPTLILSLHSFTPFLGSARPWHAAMLYGKDRTLAAAFLERLRNDAALVVGDNEPYRVTADTDYSIPNHAEQRSFPGVLIEIRQDLLSAPGGAVAWAERIASAFNDIERAGVLGKPLPFDRSVSCDWNRALFLREIRQTGRSSLVTCGLRNVTKRHDNPATPTPPRSPFFVRLPHVGDGGHRTLWRDGLLVSGVVGERLRKLCRFASRVVEFRKRWSKRLCGRRRGRVVRVRRNRGLGQRWRLGGEQRHVV